MRCNREVWYDILHRQLSTLNSFFNNKELDLYVFQLRRFSVVIGNIHVDLLSQNNFSVFLYKKKNSTSTMSIPVTKLRNCLKTCYLCIQQNQSQYIQCSEADLTSDMRECSLLFSLNIA